jgi:hypothetical protein
MVHGKSIGGIASDEEKHLQKNLSHMKFPGVKLGVP